MLQHPFDFAGQWRQVSKEMMAGIEEWRLHYPKTTLQEIEAAVDARLAELRVRLLQDVALTSQATDVSQASRVDRPICSHCGAVVEPRGPRERQVITHQGKMLRLMRSYVVCLTCQVGFSPLDEELAVLPGQLTRRLPESAVRLGTWMPFRQAAEALAFCTGMTVSEATVRRTTEGAGGAYEAVQTVVVERIEGKLPSAPAGPRVQMLSVDGAMVPWQPQAWAEVKTLAIGTVDLPVQERGEWVVPTKALS